MPIDLKNANTGKPFRTLLHTYVMPKMVVRMFLGYAEWMGEYAFGKWIDLDCGNGEMFKVNRDS